MKKYLVTLILTFVFLFSFLTTTAWALNSNSGVEIYHSKGEKTFAVGKDLFSFKNFSTTTPNEESFSIVNITVAPKDSGFLLKKHALNAEETFYPLAGTFQFFGLQPNQTTQVTAGDMIRIPAKLPYGFKNIDSKPGKLLLIVKSPNFAAFINEIGTPINEQSASASTQLNMEEIAAIANKYDLEFFN